LIVPPDVDGAAEEKSLVVPAQGHLRYRLTPQPSGARFVHSHVMPMSDLNRGTYTGQFGFVYIEPKTNPGQYDREVFLATHEWEPFFTTEEEMDDPDITPAEKARKQEQDKNSKPNGWEIGYQRFSINGKALGHGEPVRVKEGERVLFHILNGSATESIELALAGHLFQVVALDGNPVPTPTDVPVLWLGTAERISAIVEMQHPGVWVLGDLDNDDRKHGMGVVVEYAGQSGEPKWEKPKPFQWDYSAFGNPSTAPAAVDETIEMLIVKNNAALDGFNQWTLNGEAFSMASMKPMYTVHQGRRYRLKFRNASDDIHPLHLHRHSFELTRIAGKATSGVMKDVVMLGGFQEAEFDFVADNPGLTLFHCHQQLHMDFGFMALFKYA
jgi:FtsP/CotA-like multicopper oxidase with cupredoxin domain